MQRRVGPNVVGYYGLLQPFADGLKLFIKETIVPSHAHKSLFLLAPFISLSLSIIGWGPIPFAKGTALADLTLGLLFLMAVSSLAVYGVLLAGWSANSKYALLGSLRSSAQLISYELPLAMVVLTVAIIVGELSLTPVIEAQQGVWFIIPLLPLLILWLIVAIAETSRAPFDLPEGESEIIGFFVEHSALPFAFFFLAEYGSILLMSTLTSILFLGGYLLPFGFTTSSIPLQSLTLGLKASFILFLFVWVRASLPRVRYDQLMYISWSILLPLSFAYFLFVLSILIAFDYLH